MRSSTLWTTVLLTVLSQAHAHTLGTRDATSAQIPAEGIEITELAKDPDRLHDAFTTTTTTSSRRRDNSRFSSSSSSSLSSWKKAAASYADTANELTDGTPCREVTLIYARGTTQDGNIGAAGDVGPLFMDALAALVGADALAVQGVDYAANVLGFLAGGDAKGSQTMADLVALANTQCPSTKIVMSGYSQGGQLVHNAAQLLASNTAAVNQVAAVLIFGDPNDGDPVGTIPSSKVKIICHAADNICDGGILVLPDHLNYQDDAQAAAEWVATKV